MSSRRRPLCLAIAVLVCAGIGCSADLQHALDEQQANRILLALAQAGVAAAKLPEAGGRRPTYRIVVSRGEVATALAVLQVRELPHLSQRGFADVFARASLIPSPVEERALYLEALSGEIARTLETIDAVVAARVHLVLPPPDPPDPLRLSDVPRPAATASVLLKLRPDARPPAEEQIRKLVAGAASGLAPADVTVVSITTARPPEDGFSSLTRVGPFSVAQRSATAVRLTLTCTLLLVMVLATALVLGVRRLATLRRQLLELERSALSGQRSASENPP